MNESKVARELSDLVDETLSDYYDTNGFRDSAEEELDCPKCKTKTTHFTYTRKHNKEDRRYGHCNMCVYKRVLPIDNSDELKMPFGKHKGEKLRDIDPQYLKWAADNMTVLSERYRKAISSLLERK